jgi:hypothetical protein
MTLQLSQFKLYRAVFEIRYIQSFLVWDHAGVAWHQLRMSFPELKVRSAQPNQQAFSLSKSMAASAGLEMTNLTAYLPAAEPEQFGTACGFFFPPIIKQLDISNLTRVGYRVTYRKVFETKEAAAEFAFAQAPDMRRSGKHFNIDGRSLDLDVGSRWEGETTGIFVRLQTDEQRLDVDIPPEFEGVESFHVQRYGVALDLDYYAHGNTAAAKLEPRALIENWSRLIRRDVEGFFNG